MRKFQPRPLSALFSKITACAKLIKTTSLLFLIVSFAANSASAQNPVNSKAVKVPFRAPATTSTQFTPGIFKMTPQAFGVTGPVRNFPTSVEDAAAKRALWQSKKQIRDSLLKQQLREQGFSDDYIQDSIDNDEINRQNAKIIKKIQPDAGAGQAPFTDPLVNKSRFKNLSQVLSMPTPSLSFDGATQLDNAAQGIGQVLPPDVNGDVGLNHYVSSVNLVYKIFNKNGTVAAGPFKTSALWSGLPAGDPCRVNNSGDPVVVYDPLADRWHISQFALTFSTNCQCVAVSQTGDPTGAYYVWRYDYPNNLLNDYPKVGVWPDAYHMTFNQFNNAGTAFLGLGILSQDRPKALAGDPTASVVYTNIGLIDPNAGGGLPADIDGLVPPPAGMAEVIAEYRADEFGDPLDAIRYYKWVPDFVTPSNSTLTVLPDVALAAFDARQPPGRGDIEQSGGANLDGLSDRLMHRFAYRNLGTQASPVNSFVGNFSVNVSGVNPSSAANFQTGIRWFEMRRTGDAFSVFDEGTHNLAPGNGGAGLNNWMGSIAQDNKGNIALGFSQSSTTQRADIKIAGRTNNVMNSGVLNEGEALFHAAGGSQTSTSARWGDYSSMNVDPIDDCTFWYTQEYYAATSAAGWSTRIGKFVLPTCTPLAKATIQGTITLCDNGLPVSGASVNASGGFNRVTGAPGTYSMTVTPGTYTIVASKTGGFGGSSSPTITVVDGQTITVDICMTGVPILTRTTATIISENCQPANGIIDPGETVTIAFGVQNTGGANTVNDIGTLQAGGGVTSPGAPQNYGVIVAGGSPVTANFTFTADPSLVCGEPVTAVITHMDGANDLGSFTYTFATGSAGATTTASYTGPPAAIPDNNASGVNIILPVSGVAGAINDLNFRLDALTGCDNVTDNPNASLTHTFLDDLVLKLTSPAGTTVTLIANRGSGGNNFCNVLLDDDGGFPGVSTIPGTGGVAGNFAPESALSAFDGEDANGNWTLNVADLAGIDVGTLNRFSLIITPGVCCTDIPPCQLTCPADVIVNNDAGECGAVVNYDPATTTGSCGTITYSQASGTVFPVGVTTVTVNSSIGGQSCSFTVTVNDIELPLISNCPADITVQTGTGNSNCSQTASWTEPTGMDNCGGSLSYFSRSHAPGSTFSVGTTPVTYIFKDAEDNESNCTFNVIVEDNTPPVVNCPANINVDENPQGSGSASVNFAITATENCSISTVITYIGTTEITSPHTFPVGSTIVDAVAKDDAGNTSTCSFTVTVAPACQIPGTAPISDINGPLSVCSYIGIEVYATYSLNNPIANATTYTWVPAPNSQIISGQGTSTIEVKYLSNFTSGKLSVKGNNSCGSSGGTTLSYWISKAPPSTPGLFIAPITDACPFMGATPIPVTYKILAVKGAEGYVWTAPVGSYFTANNTTSFTGGVADTSVQVAFTASFTSSAIYVRATSSCGNSPQRGLGISRKVVVTPGTITGSVPFICAIVGTANTATYSIRKVANATAYNWVLSAGITFQSYDGDTAVVVTFEPGYTTGTIKVSASNNCSTSPQKSLTVTAVKPATPALISGPANVCAFVGQPSNATYSVPLVNGATGYNWSFPVGTGATIVNGAGTNSVEVSFAAGYVSGRIQVLATSGCGNGPARALTLVTHVARPGTISTSGPACRLSTVTYSIAAVPGATSYLWAAPANSSIVSGQGTTSVSITFDNSFVSGSIGVKSVNACFTSATSYITVNAVDGCTGSRAVVSAPATGVPETEAKVFPNPSKGEFTISIKTAAKADFARIQLVDVYGNVVAERKVPFSKAGNLNARFQSTYIAAGMYQARYIIGDKIGSVKVVIIK